MSLPLCFAVGWVSYRAVMRPIVHASHNVQVFTTVGLSIALQNLALVLWTADARFVRTDYYAVVVRIGGAAFNVAQIVAFAIAVALTAGLFAFMRWSYTGQGHARDGAGPAGLGAHGHRHRPRLRDHLGGRASPASARPACCWRRSIPSTRPPACSSS